MQMFLEFAEARKAKHLNDADDSSRIGIETLGHRADAQENETAWLFEHRTKNLLPLGGELSQAILKVDRLG